MDQHIKNNSAIIDDGIDNDRTSLRKTNQIQGEKCDKEEQNLQQMMDSIKQSLNTANQILPAHKKFKDPREIVSFKLSSTAFYQNSLKLNKTYFPSINITKNKQSSFSKAEGITQQINLKQQMGQFGPLISDKKILIYQRMRNEKLNFISRNQKTKQKYFSYKDTLKYFCSIFINSKLPKNQSKQKPLWQHLKNMLPQQSLLTVQDSLKFQSCFQSGNLFAVFRDNSSTFPTYELFMQNDTNTKGSTQWFYFKVSNKSRTKVKFKVINFYKTASLYEMGMKILVSSDGIEWKRVGTAISYIKNSINGKTIYSLEFIYEFQQSAKNIYFAYAYPYNYTQRLVPYIQNLLKKNYNKRCISRTVLCKSNMGNQVYLISITNNIISMKIQKPIIYVICRQHAGQTPTSFVMEGFMNFLLSNRIEADSLRDEFQFRIIPMVNVDGVISGNYRTNISGNDVNRQWSFPSKNIHPQIYYLKQQIMSNKKNVVFFLDIHAHSRKMNSFFYGSKEINQANKFFPFVCSKLNKFISYSDSSFGDDASKQTTGRVVIQKQLNLINSLTFEISFFGWMDPVKKLKHHFKISDFEQIGSSLALGMYYTEISIKRSQDVPESVLNKKSQRQKAIYKNSVKIYEKWKIQIDKQTKKDDEVLSEGSSINPQQFQLKPQQIINIEGNNTSLLNNLQQSQNKSQGINLKHRHSMEIQLSGELNQLNQLKQDQSGKRRKRNYRSLKKPGDISKLYNFQEDQEQEAAKKSNLFSYSGNEFFLMSSRDFMVKQLEGELQNKKYPMRQKYLSIDEEKLKNRKVEINFRQTSRYHDKVSEMKKAFNYCLNNNTDIDYYQSGYKTLNPTLSTNINSSLISSQNLVGLQNNHLPKRNRLKSNISTKQRKDQAQPTFSLFQDKKPTESNSLLMISSQKRSPKIVKLQKL